MRSLLLTTLIISTLNCTAQFAPPVGQTGCTAIYKDSSVIKSWATACTVIRGLQQINDASAGYTTAGDSSMVLGYSGNGVVSLGDGGIATLTFDKAITNGAGYDFAVFENGFDNYFLELAFVEVSSDGINFFRFPATSLTDDSIQVDSFDSLDATKINNLAGKYKAGYGTPFDLEDLKNTVGLDVNYITHVKIIDVVGNITTAYATYDQYGHKVNDPWPTPFPSGGFDLDAVAVLNESASGFTTIAKNDISIYPNPATNKIQIRSPLQSNFNIQISGLAGEIVMEKSELKNQESIDLSGFSKGIYFITVIEKDKAQTIKMILN